MDIQGQYHPAEVTRKVSRLFTRLGLHIDEENTLISKNPVGQATGETFAYVVASGHIDVSPAGAATYFDKPRFDAAFMPPVVGGVIALLVGLLALANEAWIPGLVIAGLGGALVAYAAYLHKNRYRLFSGHFQFAIRITSDFVVSIPGEIYEDFRPGVSNPIRVNLSVMAAARVLTRRMTDPRQDQWINTPGTNVVHFPPFDHAVRHSQGTLATIVHQVVEGLRRP